MDCKSTMQSTVLWQCGDSATAGCAVSYSCTLVAECLYDLHGHITSQNPSPNLFRYRFSTKFEDLETGLYYYCHRFYDSIWHGYTGMLYPFFPFGYEVDKHIKHGDQGTR